MKSQLTPAHELLLYLDGVDSWWPDSGETYLMLGAREYLHAHRAELSLEQLLELRFADARLLQLDNEAADVVTRDRIDLRRIAEFVRRPDVARAA